MKSASNAFSKSQWVPPEEHLLRPEMNARGRRVLFISICMGCIGLLACPGSSNGQSAAAPSNLAVLQKLIGTLGKQIVQSAHVAPKETVQVSALGIADERWIVEQALAASLRDSFVVVAGDSAHANATVTRLEVLPRLSISYGNTVGSNVFGVTAVERTASVSLEYRVLRGGLNATPGPTVLSAESVQSTQTDTVAVNDIPNLENPAVRSTQSQVPSGSLLDTLAKPLIIIGSVGTIIFLLFHIRS